MTAGYLGLIFQYVYPSLPDWTKANEAAKQLFESVQIRLSLHRVHGLVEKQHLHGTKLPLPTLSPPPLSAVECETDAFF